MISNLETMKNYCKDIEEQLSSNMDIVREKDKIISSYSFRAEEYEGQIDELKHKNNQI